MTGSANCDIVSKGRTGFCGDKLIDVLGVREFGNSRISIFFMDSLPQKILTVTLLHAINLS